MIADAEYQHPTEAWVKGAFWGGLRPFLTAISDYWLEVWDCDNFAQAAALYASILHAKSKRRREGTALLFGEFWYDRDSGGGHAINFTIVYDGAYRLIFFEPQTGEIVQISESERASCLGYRC